ncbi:MAG TPA: shikimate kinase [Acidimicrobiia bacterium]
MKQQRHLVLIGMMGAGKSTVGQRCAKRLGRPFVDTDERIAAAAGASVAEVFARDGEPAFRELERRAVADACASPEPTVIAAGGGAVLDADNRRRMRETGLVVWLQAPVAQLAARVGDGRGRPLLEQPSPSGAVGTLGRLEQQRRPAYEAAAHATVDTAGLGVASVVDAVLAALTAIEERVS